MRAIASRADNGHHTVAPSSTIGRSLFFKRAHSPLTEFCIRANITKEVLPHHHVGDIKLYSSQRTLETARYTKCYCIILEPNIGARLESSHDGYCHHRSWSVRPLDSCTSEQERTEFSHLWNTHAQLATADAGRNAAQVRRFCVESI